MSKFFHLNDCKVRLNAVNSIGSVKPIESYDDNHYAFTFSVDGDCEIRYACYKTKETAVAVYASFMEALENSE